jgi:hypothetical protein
MPYNKCCVGGIASSMRCLLSRLIACPDDEEQKRTTTEVARQQATRVRRADPHHTIRQLAATGTSYRAIARQLGVSWRSVERYAQAETVPEFAPPQPLPSILDPYLRFLHTRWAAGCRNGAQLWRETQAQDYRGG